MVVYPSRNEEDSPMLFAMGAPNGEDFYLGLQASQVEVFRIFLLQICRHLRPINRGVSPHANLL